MFQTWRANLHRRLTASAVSGLIYHDQFCLQLETYKKIVRGHYSWLRWIRLLCDWLLVHPSNITFRSTCCHIFQWPNVPCHFLILKVLIQQHLTQYTRATDYKRLQQKNRILLWKTNGQKSGAHSDTRIELRTKNCVSNDVTVSEGDLGTTRTGSMTSPQISVSRFMRDFVSHGRPLRSGTLPNVDFHMLRDIVFDLNIANKNFGKFLRVIWQTDYAILDRSPNETSNRPTR